MHQHRQPPGQPQDDLDDLLIANLPGGQELAGFGLGEDLKLQFVHQVQVVAPDSGGEAALSGRDDHHAGGQFPVPRLDEDIPKPHVQERAGVLEVSKNSTTRPAR